MAEMGSGRQSPRRLIKGYGSQSSVGGLGRQYGHVFDDWKQFLQIK